MGRTLLKKSVSSSILNHERDKFRQAKSIVNLLCFVEGNMFSFKSQPLAHDRQMDLDEEKRRGALRMGGSGQRNEQSGGNMIPLLGKSRRKLSLLLRY